MNSGIMNRVLVYLCVLLSHAASAQNNPWVAMDGKTLLDDLSKDPMAIYIPDSLFGETGNREITIGYSVWSRLYSATIEGAQHDPVTSRPGAQSFRKWENELRKKLFCEGARYILADEFMGFKHDLALPGTAIFRGNGHYFISGSFSLNSPNPPLFLTADFSPNSNKMSLTWEYVGAPDNFNFSASLGSLELLGGDTRQQEIDLLSDRGIETLMSFSQVDKKLVILIPEVNYTPGMAGLFRSGKNDFTENLDVSFLNNRMPNWVSWGETATSLASYLCQKRPPFKIKKMYQPHLEENPYLKARRAPDYMKIIREKDYYQSISWSELEQPEGMMRRFLNLRGGAKYRVTLHVDDQNSIEGEDFLLLLGPDDAPLPDFDANVIHFKPGDAQSRYASAERLMPTVEESEYDWIPYSLEFTMPEGATNMALWVVLLPGTSEKRLNLDLLKFEWLD